MNYNILRYLDKELTNIQQAKLLELLDKKKRSADFVVFYKKYNAKDVKTKLFSEILGENFIFYEDKYFSTRGDIENDKECSRPPANALSEFSKSYGIGNI